MNVHINRNLDYRSVADALACQIKSIFHDFTDEDKLAVAKYINKIWTTDVLKKSTVYMEIEEARKRYNTACEHKYLITPFSEELKMDTHIRDLLNSYKPNTRILEYAGPIPSYDTIPSVRYKFLGWDIAKQDMSLHDVEIDRAFIKANDMINRAMKNAKENVSKNSKDGLQFHSLL